ncbi:hypothetical protein ACIO3O_38105 [Streptomyces sp. NPDC087440]|uniref:hypothetical protein n=1 Tax=Streptomyces sp. NPDC087440 TaxID=3365790 RepID=UPI0038011243
MKKPYARRPATSAAAVALGVTLLAATACGATGEGGERAPHPVYSLRPADQLVAAGRATKAAGSARFTSTLTWRSRTAELVDRTTGDQSFARTVAHANRTVTVPDAFPAAVADLYGSRPGRKRHGYAVQGSDVFYRTLHGTWLRYRSGAPQEFARATGGFNERAGSVTPYGGTLADTVFGSFPTAPPRTLPDGARRYTLSADGGVAASLLPKGLTLRDSPEPAVAKTRPLNIPLTVDLDPNGRLTRATADLTPLLAEREGTTGEELSLHAELRFTHYGTTTGPPVPPGERTEDATRALTLLTGLKPGACATTDTGLDSLALVRRADCARGPHDLRVLGQIKVRKSTRERITTDDGHAIAADRCTALFTSAAPRWRAEARPAGNHTTHGWSQWSTHMGGPDGGLNTIEGEYTCYLITSTPVDPDSVQEV